MRQAGALRTGVAVFGALAVLVSGVAIFSVDRAQRSARDLPSILKGLTPEDAASCRRATGGDVGAPPTLAEALGPPKPPFCPTKLIARLNREFPPGSSVGRVRAELEHEGFRVTPSVVAQPSIGLAEYDQRLSSDHLVMWRVAWESDANGRIIWIGGATGRMILG